jgi:hypothetical protein
MLLADMKTTLSALLAVGTIGWATAAEQVTTNAPAAAGPAAVGAAPAAAAPAAGAVAAANLPKRGLSPEERVEYLTLVRGELELNAQVKLLTELIEDHAKRGEDLTRTSSPEKGQWEGVLAQELRNRRALIVVQLNQATKQRLAFEAAHPPRPGSEPGLGALQEDKPLNADEFAYVTRLDERLLSVRQELATIDDVAKGLYSELQTNSTTEAVTRVSILLDENIRRCKLWEREQFELELKKLEFRALRK